MEDFEKTIELLLKARENIYLTVKTIKSQAEYIKRLEERQRTLSELIKEISPEKLKEAVMKEVKKGDY